MLGKRDGEYLLIIKWHLKSLPFTLFWSYAKDKYGALAIAMVFESEEVKTNPSHNRNVLCDPQTSESPLPQL